MSKAVNQQVDASSGGSELEDKVVHVMRSSSVNKKGRTFSFTALVVVGNRHGKVGYGLGKGSEVSDAVRKGTEAAKKDMQQISLKGGTLQHAVTEKYGATKVFMQPASGGTGVIAGGASRAIFELLGVENVLSKIHGSTNPFNVVIATMNGLRSMEDPLAVAKRRGMTAHQVLGIEKQGEEEEA